MDLQSFFVDGFSSHDLADALQDLGFGDEVFEADATKSGHAGFLAGLEMPFPEVLNGFYPLPANEYSRAVFVGPLSQKTLYTCFSFISSTIVNH